MLKSILLILTSLLILSSCSEEPIKTNKYYKTYQTQTGSITIQDDIIATVEGNKTSSLAFRSAGIVEDILVSPGDRVKKGQVLAKLGNNEGSIQNMGLINIQKELQNLEKTTNIVQSGIENTSNAISKLYDERIKGLDTNILSLENTLEQARQKLGNQTSSLGVTFETFAHDFDRVSTAMLYEGDKILGITTNFEYANNGWEPYLGTRVGNSQSLANNDWNTLYTLRGKIRSYTETGSTITDINAAINDLKNSYIGARNFAKSMNYMLQNSVIGGGLPEEKLNGWLATWNGLSADNQGSEASFITWKNGILDLTNTGGSGSAAADKNIISLQLELANIKQSKNTLIAEKQAKLKEIKSNADALDSKKGEISVQLGESQMNASLARESLEYNIIYAPYDGVILEKYMEEGMVIGAGSPLLKISSTDGKMAKVYIDNTMYGYAEGDILSSMGGENSYTGTISLIQGQKDPLHNKNYTEVAMNGNLAIGEKITIHLEHKKSNLQNGSIIPLSAIINRYGPPGVYILDEQTARFQLVEILSSDMQFAEVMGIPEGATIITDGKENIYDGEILIVQ
ncbi:HlyD family efflux transporter periplasmic adaptor subunit [Candidatus Gracilibacteria bacterium]|nr:HlyD family efflux transporter periplasmic adaptor subunit [Candidatus Gracilibacteria bacterium]